MKSQSTAFSKEKFVNASYHFLLAPGHNYNVFMKNPDSPVNWNHVEAVIYLTETARHCPICLEPPMAAQITKCGHIFCAPCLHRYLVMADRTWARCPLCFEAVYPSALKSLIYRIHQRAKLSDSVMLVLLKRDRGTVVPIRVTEEGSEEVQAVQAMISDGKPVQQPFPVANFSRITVAKDISQVLHRERKELLQALESADTDEETAFFIRGCLAKLISRHEEWHSKYGIETDPTRLKEKKSLSEITDAWSASGKEKANVSSNGPTPSTRVIPTKPASCWGDRHVQSSPASAVPSVTGTASQEEVQIAASLKPLHTVQPLVPDSTKKKKKKKKKGKFNADTPAFVPVGVTAKGQVITEITGEGGAESYYHFYQSGEGHLLFLHPINYRALKALYSDKSLPTQVKYLPSLPPFLFRLAGNLLNGHILNLCHEEVDRTASFMCLTYILSSCTALGIFMSC